MPDEQDTLLREVFGTPEAEMTNTAVDATSRMSRTTTEEVPYSFESSNEYEGLENNRHTGVGSTGGENTPAVEVTEPAGGE